LVQQSAAEKLLTLLDIQNTDCVLDMGCGTGNLTSKIKALTKGSVIGVDASAGMIQEAKHNNKDTEITFELCDASQLNYNNTFNIIFCNSAFQWFKNTDAVLKCFYNALHVGGKVGIQAPATNNYCPNFRIVEKQLKRDPRTKDIFNTFTSPWFFLDSAEQYAQLFRKNGFNVISSGIDEIANFYTTEQAFNIFSSGAIAGYLNQSYYSKKFTDHYIQDFKEIIYNSLSEQSDTHGFVHLTFYRIFLVAKKE
jgi:trans-aconitate methyltransferase